MSVLFKRLDIMTRGNQRDVDRSRAKKRADKAPKQTAKDKDGLTATQRRERYVQTFSIHLPVLNSDKKALEEKREKKQQAKGSAG